MKKIQFFSLTIDQLEKVIANVVQQERAAMLQELQQQQPSEVYIPRKQVAAMLDVGLSTLHAWHHRGILSPVGIGGRRYYRQSDIDEAMIRLSA